MGEQATLTLIEILKKTLQHMEDAGGVDRADPAYQELTRKVTLLIAELEFLKSGRAAA